MAQPLTISDATFEAEVLQSDLPVVVDFWAPWCGPCRMVAPVIERLSAEMDGKIRFAKVNVDDNPQYAAQFGVQGIPTLLLIKDGEVVDRVVGALPEQALRAKIESVFGVSVEA